MQNVGTTSGLKNGPSINPAEDSMETGCKTVTNCQTTHRRTAEIGSNKWYNIISGLVHCMHIKYRENWVPVHPNI